MQARRVLIAAGAAAVLIVLGVLAWPRLLGGCVPARPSNGSGPSTGSGTPTAPARPVGPALIVTGEHLGEIEPCGCTHPQLGGIVHRASVLSELGFGSAAAPGLVLVDTGNLVSRPGRQQQLKYESFIAAMNAMGYHAAALGAQDLQLGLEFLRQVSSGLARFPILAANLVDATGEQPFESFHLHTLPGKDLRVGVIGLLPATARAGAGVRVTDPVAALRGLAPKIGEALRTGDRLIVMGTFDQGVAEQLASAAGRPALVIYGRAHLDPSAEMAPGGPNGATVYGIGGKGRYLAVLGLEDERVSVRQVLSKREHAGMSEVIARYQKRVADEGILDAMPRVRGRVAFVGSTACKACHGEAFAVWERSRHGRAMDSLTGVRHHRDPECVTCHVVGLEVKGGFRSLEATPELGRVGCESCHGAGAAHVSEPTRSGLIDRGSPQTCRRCHTHEHDPKFEFEKRWGRIAH